MRFITRQGLALLLTAVLAVGVFVGTAAAQEKGTFTDSRDKKTYKTVKIGKQTWMAENLNFPSEDGSWCYNRQESNCNTYGRLYDWNDAEVVCPEGWHLPSAQEWDNLVTTAGGKNVAGKKLKSKSGWNKNGNGSDEYGFSALPGGARLGGGFLQAGAGGFWWTASQIADGWAYRYIDFDKALVNDEIDREGLFASVRCVQN